MKRIKNIAIGVAIGGLAMVGMAIAGLYSVFADQDWDMDEPWGDDTEDGWF